MDENELERLRKEVYAKHKEAEKAAYEYACACEVGPDSERAFDCYENIRRAMRVI